MYMLFNILIQIYCNCQPNMQICSMHKQETKIIHQIFKQNVNKSCIQNHKLKQYIIHITTLIEVRMCIQPLVGHTRLLRKSLADFPIRVANSLKLRTPSPFVSASFISSDISAYVKDCPILAICLASSAVVI